jgi:hypothetical protein
LDASDGEAKEAGPPGKKAKKRDDISHEEKEARVRVRAARLYH